MQNLLLIIISWAIVAFGQPAFSPWLSFLAASIGYACFWRVAIEFPSWKARFFMGTSWFFAVQLVQLFWFVSHPYLYIYGVYVLFSLAIGAQFGVLTAFLNPEKCTKLLHLLAAAAIWTLLEIARLYPLSGFSWNPAGLSLAANVFSLQAASIGGIYLLSFIVIFSNLLLLRFWISGQGRGLLAAAVLGPYLFGAGHYYYHERFFKQFSRSFNVLLVQPAFPAEEALGIATKEQFRSFVLGEWKQILSIVCKHLGKSVDLIALPEFTVPYGTYTMVYPYESVFTLFHEVFGKDGLSGLPPLESPYARKVNTEHGEAFFVNNAFFSKALANIFKANIVIGLEDVEEVPLGKRDYYSGALYFQCGDAGAPACRYDKRILVPFGEYIPFAVFQKLAASYGISSSFTHGKEAKVFVCGSEKIAPSICYEETFGHMMREGRILGASVFVNLTSDVWYPNSRLPRQHFEHARPRSVENGVALVRACNTGLTGAVDALGRTIGVLEAEGKSFEWLSDSILLSIPTYSYKTLYTRVGDNLIIFLSFSVIVIYFFTLLLEEKKRH